MTPDLSLIVVSYNTGEILRDCVRSLLDQEQGDSFELIVIENAVHLEARRLLSDLASSRKNDPRTCFIQNEENLGFAKGCNQGLAMAKGRHLMLLNPDTFVPANTVGEILKCLDTLPETVGIVGFRLENPDGSAQVAARTLPTWQVAFAQHTLLGAFGLFSGATRQHKLEGFAFDQPRDVGLVMGAAFAFSRRVYDCLGPLDEGFFVYYEEVDYCRRAQEAGLTVRFQPTPAIRHFGGVSSAQLRDRMFGVYLDSLFRYHKKWMTPAGYRLFQLCFKSLFVPMLFLDILKYAFKMVLNKLRGKRKQEKVERARRELMARLRFLSGPLWRFLGAGAGG